MHTKVIKTETDYNAALASIERLMEGDPDLGTAEADELELLTLLVQDFEAKRFPATVPDPISAIRFRMEQQGLSPRDLIPYIGGRSKVSEVLSGKRPLSLTMIRALNEQLGIPAKVLLQGREQGLTEEQDDLDWQRFPIRELARRGWVTAKVADAHHRTKEIMQRFFAPIGTPSLVAARYLRCDHIRSARNMDRYSLAAWSARVLMLASRRPCAEFKPGTINSRFMREVAQLSWSSKGPLLAQEFLGRHGICLVVEAHLPRTFLDGAAMMSDSGNPVIGLTLRHDRIDNFWFSLMHELAHVFRHLTGTSDAFFDDLDSSSRDNLKESEADDLATEVLIPEKEWAKSPARSLRSPEAAEHLAKQLRIHPAIVAGRMRYEAKSYRILNQMIGFGRVRPLFPDVQWN